MLRNYLKVAIRSLLRHKAYTLINVAGLGMGMAFCVLALVYARYERGYDTFHEKADRTFLLRIEYEWRVGFTGTNYPVGTPARLRPVLLDNFPEFEAIARFAPVDFSEGSIPLRRGETRVLGRGLYADPEAFELFSFPQVRGDARQALRHPSAIVLSHKVARVLFGVEDPVGQTVSLRQAHDAQAGDFTVAAVVRVPENSSIQAGFFLPMALTPIARSLHWGEWNFHAFALLGEGTDLEALEGKMQAFFPAYMASQGVVPGDRFGGERYPLRLTPITDLHLRTDLRYGIGETSNPVYSQILAALALAVLLAACVNFANLSIGMAASRAREVGVRKVLGGTRAHLIRQFWGEALILSALSLAVAVAVSEMVLPAFGALVGRDLHIHYGKDWTVLVGVAAFTALVAGSYPAIVLSALPPVHVLAGRLRMTGTRSLGRGLVVLQFAFSTGLIVATLAMSKQIDYLRTRDLGFRAEQVVVLDAGRRWDEAALDRLRQLVRAYRDEASRRPEIESVSVSNMVYATGWYEGRTIRDAAGQKAYGRRYDTGWDFVEAMGLEIVAGRDFSPEHPSDPADGLLVNEELIRTCGLDEVVGRGIPSTCARSNLTGDKTVIGVVGDFHLRPVQESIEPAVIHLDPASSRLRHVLVRIRPQGIPETLALLRAHWQRILPDRPFSYSFLDQEVERSLRADRRWQSVSRYSAGLAVFIACLGVFGLSALAAERRTKEIGIRKVLGATVPSLLGLLSREFTWLVLGANALAWPASYLALSRWLEDYAYRVDIGWGLFAAAGGAALAVAWLASSWQTLRVARANPVEALRYE